MARYLVIIFSALGVSTGVLDFEGQTCTYDWSSA
jgi:hypothetical protein